MKKLIALFLILTMAVSFAACAAQEETPAEDLPAVEEDPTMNQPADMLPDSEEGPAIDEPATMPEEEVEMPEVESPEAELPVAEPMPEEKLMEMSDLMEQLVGGINDELMVMTGEVMSDAFEYHLFIPYMEGAYAVVSMPMIGSIAHEVVLLELPEGADVEAVAAEIEANMNPRKWVCVEAEEAWVKTSGQYVLLVMSTTEMADAIEANFNTVFGA